MASQELRLAKVFTHPGSFVYLCIIVKFGESAYIFVPLLKKTAPHTEEKKKTIQGKFQKNVQWLGTECYKDDVSFFYKLKNPIRNPHMPLSPPSKIFIFPHLTLKALCITADSTHPHLPSGKRVQRLWGRISRLKDNFVHQAVMMLNSHLALPPPLPAPHVGRATKQKIPRG